MADSASINPIQAVNLAAAVYDPQPSDFDWFGGCGFVTLGVKHLSNCDAVVPKGSITDLDWIRDALSETPTTIPGFEALGPMPFGFSLKAVEAYHDLAQLLRPSVPLVISGHSLGAQEAIALGAMHIVAGGVLGAIFAFEPPRAGGHLLTKVLEPYPVYLTINGADPVPHLPTLPWERPRAPILLDQAPEGIWAFDPIKWHSIKLVQAGVTALAAA